MSAVDKIIFNLLASRGRVVLPDVGTLIVEVQPARRASDGSLEPPRRTVRFSHNIDAADTALFDTVGSIAGVDRSEAESIYRRWLRSAVEGKNTEIEDVGVVKSGFFVVSRTFASAINPESFVPLRPVKLRRKGHKTALWVALAVVAVVAVAAGVWLICGDRLSGLATRPSAPRAANTAAVASRPTESDRSNVEPATTAPTSADTPTAADPADRSVAQSESESLPADQKSVEAVGSSDSATSAVQGVAADNAVRYCVVIGVFSTDENARRCIEQDKLKIGADNYAVYPFQGQKYLVGAYTSTDRNAVDTARRRLAQRSSGVWVWQIK